MEFDLSIRENPPQLLSLFPENSCLQSERLASQKSVLTPQQPSHPFFNHHFHDHILRVPSNNHNHEALVVEGPPHTARFFGIPIPTIPTAQSSKTTSDFCANQATFAPNTKSDGLDKKSIFDFSQKAAKIQSSGNLIDDGNRVQNDSNVFNKIKGKWTSNEDIELMQLVNQHGAKNWSQIEKLMRGRRDAKQCRERYLKYLYPDLKKDSWSLEEDKRLIEGHQELGTKWANIAKRLPGRTEVAVKNHWYTTKRRQSFTINKKSKINEDNDGSLLHAYIKKVTAAEDRSTEKLEIDISEIDESGGYDDIAHFQMQTNGSTNEFKCNGSMGNGQEEALVDGGNIEYGTMVGEKR